MMSVELLRSSQCAHSWEGHYVTGLREVVRDLMYSNDRLTWDQLAQRTGIAKQTLHKTLTGQNKRMPSPEILDAAARALGVPSRVLHEAAAETYGIQVRSDAEVDVLIDYIGRLDERRQREVTVLVKAMLMLDDD